MQRSRSAAHSRANAAFVGLLLALALAGFAYGWYFMNRPGAPPPRATLIRADLPAARHA